MFTSSSSIAEMSIVLFLLSKENSVIFINLSVQPPSAVGGSSCVTNILSPISKGSNYIGKEKLTLLKPPSNLANHLLPILEASVYENIKGESIVKVLTVLNWSIKAVPEVSKAFLYSPFIQS